MWSLHRARAPPGRGVGPAAGRPLDVALWAALEPRCSRRSRDSLARPPVPRGSCLGTLLGGTEFGRAHGARRRAMSTSIRRSRRLRVKRSLRSAVRQPRAEGKDVGSRVEATVAALQQVGGGRHGTGDLTALARFWWTSRKRTWPESAHLLGPAASPSPPVVLALSRRSGGTRWWAPCHRGHGPSRGADVALGDLAELPVEPLTVCCSPARRRAATVHRMAARISLSASSSFARPGRIATGGGVVREHRLNPRRLARASATRSTTRPVCWLRRASRSTAAATKRPGRATDEMNAHTSCPCSAAAKYRPSRAVHLPETRRIFVRNMSGELVPPLPR